MGGKEYKRNMFTYLYDWMYQITFYLVIFTAALQLLPSGKLQKVRQIFCGTGADSAGDLPGAEVVRNGRSLADAFRKRAGSG